MCKSPGVGSALDEHNRQSRLRKLNQEFKKLAPASEAELVEQVATLEQRVEELERQLKQAQQDKLKIQVDTLTNPTIYPSMKAGCIGEVTFPVPMTCPECYANSDDEELDPDLDCQDCHGEILYSHHVEVPWTTQKEIFKMMCKYKAIALEQERNEENK